MIRSVFGLVRTAGGDSEERFGLAGLFPSWWSWLNRARADPGTQRKPAQCQGRPWEVTETQILAGIISHH